MIKINLATRKQATAAAGDDGGKSAGKGVQGFLGIFKDNARLDDIKELPIRKLAVSILLCFAANYFLDGYKEDELAKLNVISNRAHDEQAKLKADLGKTAGYEALKKSLDADELTLRTKIETIQKLLAGRQTPPKMLTALSSALPPEVWLKSFKIAENEVNFKGDSLGFNQISDFMKSLNESAYFTDVQLQGTAQERDEVTGGTIAGFELQAKRR